MLSKDNRDSKNQNVKKQLDEERLFLGNPSNPKLLLIIKQFCNEANRLSLLGDEYSSMKAILYIDFAVEQMLNVIILDYNTSTEIDSKRGRDEITWQILWQNATASIKHAKLKALSHYKDLKSLHEIRNLVQHRGQIPSASDVTRYVASATRWISECFEKCYGFNFDNFRLTDTIRNQHLRGILEDSEEALALDSPNVSLAGSIMAFNEVVAAIRPIKEGLSYNFNHAQKAIARQISSFRTKQPIADQLSRLLEDVTSILNHEIQLLRVDVEVTNLGLSMAETTKFRQIMNSIGVHVGDDGSCEIVSFGSTLNYAEYAKLSLNYLSSLVLLSQEVYPEAIDKIKILIPLHKQAVWNSVEKSRTAKKEM
jgi:hypothetical protein